MFRGPGKTGVLPGEDSREVNVRQVLVSRVVGRRSG